MRSYHIIFATLLMLFLCSPTLAQQEVIGEVIIGENGYEIPVEVINKNEEAIKSVTVKLIEKPAGFKNVTIEPQQVDTLAVGETAVFMLQFDVDENAEAQDFAEIIFSVEAENAEFDEPEPVVAVAIAGREKEENSVFKRILRLVDVEWVKPPYAAKRVISHFHNEPGFSVHYEKMTDTSSETYGVGFTAFPLKIVAGEPFSISFEGSIGQAAKYWCYSSGSRHYPEDITVVFSAIGSNVNQHDYFTSKKEILTCQSANVSISHTNESLVQVKVNFTPRKVTNPSFYGFFSESSYTYAFSINEGDSIGDLEDQTVLIYWRDDNHTFARGPSDTLRSDPLLIQLKGVGPADGVIHLKYEYVPERGSFLTDVPTYTRPDAPRSDGIGKSDQDHTVNDEPHTGKLSERDKRVVDSEAVEEPTKAEATNKDKMKNRPAPSTGEHKTTTGGRGKTKEPKPKNKPDTNKGINPKDPKTAAIIKEWISSAEPSINATGGANARYEPYGRVIGKIIGGIGRVTGNPDDTAGRTPEKYVWDKRDSLDSVDHCTLGEYVTAKLKNQSIDHCKGRYKPEVSDVVGMSKKRAEKELKGKGLKTKVSLGSPASTKQDSLTVEKTIPDAGSMIKRGGMVTLVVHPPFVDRRTVPEFKGSTAEEVIGKIKDVGLKPKKNTVKASSADQSGKVSSLDPPPGTEILAGATVFVDVFGPFDNKIKIPDVIGLNIRKAADVIKAAGFTPAFELAADTKDPKKDKTIARQIPEPGMKIVAGSEIKMFIYTLKAESKTIPNLVGMPIAKAHKNLQNLGLVMTPELGKNASKKSDNGRVYKQSPEPGIEVVAGAAINVLVYGEYESPKPNAVATKPATEKSDPARKQKHCALGKSGFIYDPDADYFVFRSHELTKHFIRNYLIFGDYGERSFQRAQKIQAEGKMALIMKAPLKELCPHLRENCPRETANELFFVDLCGEREEPATSSSSKVIFSDSVDSFGGGKAVNANKVPNVIGLGIQEAANEIKGAGFIPAFELGADTTDPGKDKTIARQVPKPGKEIAPGDEVKMFIYTYKARSKTIPNLIGMPIGEAHTILQEKGLSMAPELGDDASKVNDVGRVYKQSPESGSELSEDMAINVWVYGERVVEEKPLATNSGGVPFVTIPDLPAGWPITIEITDHFGGWTGLNDSKVRRGQQYSRPTNGFLAEGNKVHEIFISNSKMVLRVFWLENSDKIPMNRLLYDGIDFVRLCSSRKSRPFFTPRYGTTVYPVGDDRFTSFISDSINYQSSRAWAMVQLYAVAGLIEQNKAKYFRIVKDMMAEIEPYAKSCQDDK